MSIDDNELGKKRKSSSTEDKVIKKSKLNNSKSESDELWELEKADLLEFFNDYLKQGAYTSAIKQLARDNVEQFVISLFKGIKANEILYLQIT